MGGLRCWASRRRAGMASSRGSLTTWDVVVDAAVKRLGGNVRSELEALRNKLNDDKVAKEVIAPALLLIQAERLGVNETTLRYFTAVASGAVGGDGHVSAALKKVELASGKRAVARLWTAALAAHDIRAKVEKVGSVLEVLMSGVDAARLAGLYFLYGSPLLEGDDRLKNHKLDEAMKLAAEGLDVSWEELRRRTKGGPVAADLTIQVGGAAVKYNLYLRKDHILLQFASSDRSRAELAARLLRLAGVRAEVKKEGGRDEWYVYASTDRLAARHEKLREALAEIVRKAAARGWVDAGMAERWLEKLEKGRVLREGWPKYYVGLIEGALVVRFSSTDSGSIEREAQRLRDMGLEEGKHFTVKTPEEGRYGYIYILREGLARAARLSVYGKDEQQRRLAAAFVEHILQRAGEEGEDVYEKATRIVEEGKARGSLTLKGFDGVVEVGGREHVVEVTGWGAEIEEGQVGRKLLRLEIKAKVDGVRGEYAITYSRRGARNAAIGRAYARGDAPEVRETDAERYSAVIKALTGKEPWVYRRSDGKIMIECYEGHLEGFARYAEFADTIEKWLEETRR
jgi:hypothetical protein